MLRIGLTGGIASGKSTVAALFAARGATVIDTDVIAREVVEPGSRTLAALVNALGGDILDGEGRLDRAELRRRLFAAAGIIAGRLLEDRFRRNRPCPPRCISTSEEGRRR